MGTNYTWLENCTRNISNHDSHCRAIFYARTISAALSIIGCCLVLFIIVVYKKYKFYTQRIVMYLLLPSILVAATSLNPDISNDSRCEVLGFLFNFGILSQRLLIMCLVVHLTLFVLLQNRPRYFEVLCHVFVWGVSLAASIVPVFGDYYGPAGVWCWITEKEGGNLNYEFGLRLGCFYIWMLSCVMLEMVCFVVIVVRIRRQIYSYEGTYNPDVEARKQLYKRAIYPLLAYPCLDFFLAIPVTVNRAQNWINPDSPVFALYLMHSIVYPAWGFCNAMMYLINRETLQQLHPRALWTTLINWTRNTFSSATSGTRTVVNDYTVEVVSNPLASDGAMGTTGVME